MNDPMYQALKLRHGLEACIELGDINQSPETLVEHVIDLTGVEIDPNDYARALEVIGQWITDNE